MHAQHLGEKKYLAQQKELELRHALPMCNKMHRKELQLKVWFKLKLLDNYTALYLYLTNCVLSTFQFAVLSQEMKLIV